MTAATPAFSGPEPGTASAAAPAPETAPATDHVRIEGLTFDYGGDRPAVDDVSFSIARGEFVGLLGPSGCGKSTTLRLFAGLLSPTSGQILIGGQDISALPPWERNLGLVFQSYALFPHMTVADNVAFGLKLRKAPRAEIADRVAEALRVVRLEEFGKRRPAELSGGQQQRVAIARAIVIQPDILLLDEPLSNLDARLRDEMRFELREIQNRTGITTLFVTHDQQEALTMCDRIAVMEGGRLEQIDTPQAVYDRPASRFVATFIGRANALPCSVRTDGSDTIVQTAGLNLIAPAGTPVMADAVAMLRPHALSLTPAGAGLTDVTIRRRVFVGNIIETVVALDDGQELIVELAPGGPGDALAVEGARAGLTWQADAMRVFPA